MTVYIDKVEIGGALSLDDLDAITDAITEVGQITTRLPRELIFRVEADDAWDLYVTLDDLGVTFNSYGLDWEPNKKYVTAW